MGSHARMLAALGAALVLSIAAGAAPAFAADVTVRAEINTATLMTPLVERTAATVTPGGPAVDGCASDSAIAALRQVLPQTTKLAVQKDPGTGAVSITTVMGKPTATTPAPSAGGPSWVVYYGGTPRADPCASLPIAGSEVLVYLQCAPGTSAANQTKYECFNGRPLTMYPVGGNLADTKPFLTQKNFAAIVTRFALPGDPFKGEPALTADVVTDEDTHFKPFQEWPKDGTTYVVANAMGPHQVVATETLTGTDKLQYKMVPDRFWVCATDGHDGYCGTEKLIPPPPDFGQPPSPCDTNGHDGNCGTVDTSGPPTHVTNITDKQVFKKSSAPTKVVGTIDVDRSGFKQVLLRLTRVSTARVVVKPKKKKASSKKKAKKSSLATASATKKKAKKKKKPKVRYRTVKRCTYWSHDTLLLEKAKKCGAKYGKWFQGDVPDVPTEFSYTFEMKLPVGKYLLEVQAQDADGHPDDVTPGRNVITFTVK